LSNAEVRFAEGLSRIRGIFRVFWDMRQAEVTAVKTVWRREWDSNPRQNVPATTYRARTANKYIEEPARTR
jgi:hypothetical protein